MEKFVQSSSEQKTSNNVADQRDVRIFELDPAKPEHLKAFFELNKEWIEAFFKMEDIDFEVLQNPKQYILEPGGKIFLCEKSGKILGTCALMPRGKGRLELAKMAVAPQARGMGLGALLMRACLESANVMGAGEIFLISNRTLLPALRLYRSFGFEEVEFLPGEREIYKRGDIKMKFVV